MNSFFFNLFFLMNKACEFIIFKKNELSIKYLNFTVNPLFTMKKVLKPIP